MLYIKNVLCDIAMALGVFSFAFTMHACIDPEKVYAATPEGKSTFHYRFKVDGVLQETGSPEESSSPYFWLNSGGSLVLKNEIGATLHGALDTGSLWQRLYSLSSSLDTSGGTLPQNLFRLITKSTWGNVEEQIRFRIDAINTTDTPNRDGYSGVLLLSRYRDGNNLYYAGVRMDGAAVIKKKYKGTYYTLASAKVFSENTSFDRESNPNLIPEDRWMGLRSITTDLSNGTTKIELWLDRADTGNWELIASTIDSTTPLRGTGRAGIRTDYADVSFDDYILTERN